MSQTSKTDIIYMIEIVITAISITTITDSYKEASITGGNNSKEIGSITTRSATIADAVHKAHSHLDIEVPSGEKS